MYNGIAGAGKDSRDRAHHPAVFLALFLVEFFRWYQRRMFLALLTKIRGGMRATT
jgi:hypothetical protein